MKGFFKIMPGGVLVPADPETKEYIEKKKIRSVIKCEMTTPQNYKFHQKLIELFKAGYAVFEPKPVEINGKMVKVQKTFKQFRKDITILAGYYEMRVRLNGEIIYEAQSISFAGMEPEDREKLFSNVINVLLKHVLKNYTKDDLENQVNIILGFDS